MHCVGVYNSDGFFFSFKYGKIQMKNQIIISLLLYFIFYATLVQIS